MPGRKTAKRGVKRTTRVNARRQQCLARCRLRPAKLRGLARPGGPQELERPRKHGCAQHGAAALGLATKGIRMTSIVSIKNVVKRYTRGKQKVEVLHGIDLEVATGEFLA